MGFDDRLAEGLAALDRETLRRSRRVLDSPQGPHVRVGGRDLANFSSNDYLGLAADPRLVEAVRRSLDDYGARTTKPRSASRRSAGFPARSSSGAATPRTSASSPCSQGRMRRSSATG
jgi:7-keto-8-aminopelargonate synthetase-like enzyme